MVMEDMRYNAVAKVWQRSKHPLMNVLYVWYVKDVCQELYK